MNAQSFIVLSQGSGQQSSIAMETDNSVGVIFGAAPSVAGSKATDKAIRNATKVRPTVMNPIR